MTQYLNAGARRGRYQSGKKIKLWKRELHSHAGMNIQRKAKKMRGEGKERGEKEKKKERGPKAGCLIERENILHQALHCFYCSHF